MSVRRPCIYQPQCPGCSRFGHIGLPQSSLTQLRAFLDRFQGPSLEVHSGEGVGHRYRCRLSVRGRAGDVKIGIFEAGSHRLVHIPDCPVHHPAITELCGTLVRHLNDLGIEPYDESTHTGQLRAVQFAVQPATFRVQLGLLVLAETVDPSALDSRLIELSERLEPLTHSLFWGALPRRDNSLFAQSWHRSSGPEMMEDWVCGAQVYFPPDAFGQANPITHAQAVERIHDFVDDADPVIEYYAGVGTIGLGLCSGARKVTFNEVGAGSLRGLLEGIKQVSAQTEVLSGHAGEYCQAFGPSDVVILDPPRKGLDAPLLDRLLDFPPRRIIYLSCGLPALLREATLLMETGHYELKHASAWSYFPFTEHIESLMVFEGPRL